MIDEASTVSGCKLFHSIAEEGKKLNLYVLILVNGSSTVIM